MSTASVVPETRELHGDDAIETLHHASLRQVMIDAAQRFRWADGFSHSRALAFQTVLAFLPGMIVLVGLAVLMKSSTLSRTILGTINGLVPGPVGQVFKQAADQGAGAASRGGNIVALVTGGLALAISGTTAFGQIERGANRIYGVEKDRPTSHKYALAAVLGVSVGACLALAFVLLAAGRAVTNSLNSGGFRTAWNVGRWPLGIVLLALAYSAIFKFSPKRRQPSMSWLLVGSLVSVILNVVGSIGLASYLNASGSFGDTYGPLAGFLGVMIWAYVGSIGLYFGLAISAQLEAVRAGRAGPQSAQKVAESEPASATSAAPIGS
jgi:YihY family inner membrane protein